jgi:hypothetical protein
MLAPVTGVSTYTFNSPGVLQILRKYSSSPQKLRPGQEVVTFIANGVAVLILAHRINFPFSNLGLDLVF